LIDYTTSTAHLTLEQREAWLDLTEEFPAQTMIPTQDQAKFYRAVGTLTPQVRIFLMTSGNGTGKTCAVINLVYNVVYGNVNIYSNIKDNQTGAKCSGFFDYPLYNDFPASWPHEIWYVSNADSLKTIIKRFREWGPKRNHEGKPIQIDENKEGKTYTARISFPGTDWILYFKTDEQDPRTFESAEISLLIFDEPPPYVLFKAGVSRLRGGGVMLVPATPLMGAAYFVDEIIEKVDEDKDKWHQTVNVWSNCVEEAGEWNLGEYGIQNKGNLRKENIEFTLRNYDPDELEARRDGVFKYLSGLVYKSYNRKVHFRKVTPAPMPRTLMYRMILDPHDRKPPVVMWVRFDRFGRRSIIREWPSRTDKEFNKLPFHKIKDSGSFTIKDFCQFWIEIEEQLNIPMNRIQRIIDPNYGNKINRRTGKKLYEEYMIESQAVYKKLGYPPNTSFSFITDVNDDVAIGHKAVKALLKPTSSGDLWLEVDESCFNVNYGFTHYAYAERTPKEHEKHGMTEKVKEYAKDFPDLIRYDAMIPFTWMDLDMPVQMAEFNEDYGGAEPESGNWRKKVLRGEGADFT